MINFYNYINENKTEHIENSHIFEIIYKKEALDQEKNALLNLISNHPDIDKIYLYAKDPYEAKNQYLINICVKTGLNHYNNLKAFMEYLNDMQYVTKILKNIIQKKT